MAEGGGAQSDGGEYTFLSDIHVGNQYHSLSEVCSNKQYLSLRRASRTPQKLELDFFNIICSIEL